MIQIYWSVLAVSRTPRAHSSGPVSGAHMCRLLVPATLVKVAGQMSGCCWLLCCCALCPDTRSLQRFAQRAHSRQETPPPRAPGTRVSSVGERSSDNIYHLFLAQPLDVSMHEMVCQLCNTGGGDVVTPWPLLRSGSLQLTFSQSTFIMTTTASSQHNTVSLGHILCFTMGSFSSKIDWFNVRCKMPRTKQKVQF